MTTDPNNGHTHGRALRLCYEVHLTPEQEAAHQQWLGSTRQTLRALANQLDTSLRADLVSRDARRLAGQTDIELSDLKALVSEAEALRQSIDSILGDLKGNLR